MANTTKSRESAKVDLKELEARTLQAELLAREAEATVRLYEARSRLKALRQAAPRTAKGP